MVQQGFIKEWGEGWGMNGCKEMHCIRVGRTRSTDMLALWTNFVFLVG